MMASRKSSSWANGALAVLRKDLQLELRNKSVLGTLLIFVLSTMFLILVAAGRGDLEPRTEAALLWIVIFFTAALGLGRAFLSEKEQKTRLFLRIHTQPLMVYAGKLCYSFLTILCANVVSACIFLLLLGVEVALPGLFILTLILGTLGLAGATTLLAAIIARTTRSGVLLPVLLFPLLVPLLLAAVESTYFSFVGQSFTEGGWAASLGSLLTITSFSGVVVAASVLLFDYVWQD